MTRRQREYLSLIRQYTWLVDVPPSEGDIAAYFGVSGASAHQMIVTLERRGFIDRIPGAARSIHVLIPPEELSIVGWEGSEDSSGPDRAEPTEALRVTQFLAFLAQRIRARHSMAIARLSVAHRLAARAESALRDLGALEEYVAKVIGELLAQPWLDQDARAKDGKAESDTPSSRARQRIERVLERLLADEDPRQGRLF